MKQRIVSASDASISGTSRAIAEPVLWQVSVEDERHAMRRGLLNRWGASENTFKHLADKHPLNYQPGYEFVKSEKQSTSPGIDEIKRLLKQKMKNLNKLCRNYRTVKRSAKMAACESIVCISDYVRRYSESRS